MWSCAPSPRGTFKAPPFCKDGRREREPNNLKTLFYVDSIPKDTRRSLRETSRMEVKDVKARLHVYEWINDVPLNGNNDAPFVNYFSYGLFTKKKRTYYNNWVTDIRGEKNNIEELVGGPIEMEDRERSFQYGKEPWLPHRA
jgi:hypothetical protein